MESFTPSESKMITDVMNKEEELMEKYGASSADQFILKLSNEIITAQSRLEYLSKFMNDLIDLKDDGDFQKRIQSLLVILQEMKEVEKIISNKKYFLNAFSDSLNKRREQDSVEKDNDDSDDENQTPLIIISESQT